MLAGEELDFRIQCLAEELLEFGNAKTLAEQYDALLDLIVFAAGTINQQGLSLNPGFMEVMRANYQKEVGTNPNKDRSKTGWSVDLVKPEGFKKPDVQAIIDFTRMSRSHGNDVHAPIYPLVNRPAKVLVLGHGRHGKDTFANMLFESLEPTSYIAAEVIMMSAFESYDKNQADGADVPYMPRYLSPDECYQDRHNHRAFWYDEIKHYNFGYSKHANGSKFAEQVLKRQDCYVGMRSLKEYYACRGLNLFDVIFWVDRFEHQPAEGLDSMNIDYDPDKMIFIDNNQDLANLRLQADYYKELLKACFSPGRN